MKALIRGDWHPVVRDMAAYRAARAAQPADLLRGRVTADGSSDFPAAPGRYHLYVSYACPFSQRAILARRLKGLEEAIPMSVLHPRWGPPDGWTFTPDPHYPEATLDKAHGLALLWQVYTKAVPTYTGRVTVPLLWDCERDTAVSNESADIVRMFELAFGAYAGTACRLFPAEQAEAIEALSAMISRRVNAAVYRAGLATSQADYDRAVTDLFAALDALEARLSDGRPFLLGERLLEPDLLLFPTLARCEAVYFPLFRCNLRRFSDY
ncbi:MAG: glutathione S-transferase C-terminal domain-containing protein, partial [Kiloniellales bacterium]|nr:glutathione S-transferase C-terminal domain-containing protein [Kiloniellales bacterium]